MSDIEEKFSALSPGSQDAVRAFIEFLLSREQQGGEVSCHDGEIRDDISDEFEAEPIITLKSPECSSGKPADSGIILAEERPVPEESVIDFADINTRFSQKEPERHQAEPVRQRKMFDWL